MKIEPDRRAADTERAGKNFRDEILRRRCRKRRVERHHNGSVETGGGKQAQLVAFTGELKQGLLRPQEQPRVRREGQCRRLAAERTGALERGPDHRAMAAMHAVEIADRHHGAGQRTAGDPLRAAADDMEVLRGRFRPCHRNAMELQEIAVRNVHIISSPEHSGRRYG